MISGKAKILSLFFMTGLLFSYFSYRAEEMLVTAGNGKQVWQKSRVVCLSPSATELLFAAGAGDKVVGVSDYTVFPSEATERKKVGGWLTPSIETIVSLNPDLVVSQSLKSGAENVFKKFGIEVLDLKIETLSDIKDAASKLGRALDCKKQAADFIRKVDQKVSLVKKLAAKRDRKKVFFSIGRTPGEFSALTTVTGKTFLHELVEIAGGDNPFKELPGTYPQVSKEALLKKNPDIIVECFPDGLTLAQKKQLVRDWRVMPGLDAVKNGRIHFITADYILIPGSRVAKSLERVYEVIHQEKTDGTSFSESD